METKLAECPLGSKCEEVKTVNGAPVLYQCPWYTKVRGLDPNTGEELDHWKCAIAWIPTLLVNTANETRKGAVATESFRNEMTKSNASAAQALLSLLAPPKDSVRPALLYSSDKE